MKRVIFGGMLFIGGAIMYAIGVLGIADVEVQAHYMQAPQYVGLLSITAGVILGVIGLKKE